MEVKLKIVWDKEAIFQLQDIYDYLKEKSPEAANNVRKAIIEDIMVLINQPEIYPPDKYKIPKDNRYRAFEKYSLRVAYFITDAEIRILRIRHTSRKPKSY